jgi:uncharacterized SAM-binding protein YcdF (DUF218 family)
MRKFITISAILLILLFLAGPWLMTRAGEFLVVDETPLESADAVVVLTTGVDYLPRLMQAAELYKQGLAKYIVVNGNRKTDIHRKLEKQGYVSPGNWYDSSIAILEFLGVKRTAILFVNAEDVFDTVSEAETVGPVLAQNNIRSIIVTTSKFHTRRSIAIWRHLYESKFDLQVMGASEDPFEVDGWWLHGRQIRQLLGEYGGWLYFWGDRLTQ